MIEYNVESTAECLEEIKPLLENNHEELSFNKDIIELSPDYDKYISLENLGMAHLITVRDDKVLVGYAVTLCVDNFQYKDHKFAVNNVMYLNKDYRSQGVGTGLIRYMENFYKNLGASVLEIHSNSKNPFDKLCEHLGYAHTSSHFSKCLGDR